MDTLTYQTNTGNVNWDDVPRLLEKVGMSFTDAETHRISFEAGYAVIFVFDGERLIGCGRILSDGVRQSAIYDVAVDPAYQGKSIGITIVKRLMEATPGCNFILYASPGKEGFYRKLGFRKMKTGMALFSNRQRMEDRGFTE